MEKLIDYNKALEHVKDAIDNTPQKSLWYVKDDINLLLNYIELLKKEIDHLNGNPL